MAPANASVSDKLILVGWLFQSDLLNNVFFCISCCLGFVLTAALPKGRGH